MNIHSGGFAYTRWDMASKRAVEEGSVDKTVPIVIPSLKTHTTKEWFEFAFTESVYGKIGCSEQGWISINNTGPKPSVSIGFDTFSLLQ